VAEVGLGFPLVQVVLAEEETLQLLILAEDTFLEDLPEQLILVEELAVERLVP
jgi:hypothetical protein